MMNNKIPVALVFCLVAISASLAQPDLSNGVKTYIPKKFKIVSRENQNLYCWYRIIDCKVNENDWEHCKIDEKRVKSDPPIGGKGYFCPTIPSKIISLQITREEFYYHLKFNTFSLLFRRQENGRQKLDQIWLVGSNAFSINFKLGSFDTVIAGDIMYY
eukprot:Nk52_evm1s255 gene=Nk52_evmTU1s255